MLLLKGGAAEMTASIDNAAVITVLNALADCRSQFSARAIQWRHDDRVSQAHTYVDVGRYPSGAELEIGLDVDLRGGGTVSWLLEVSWAGGTWDLNASLRQSADGGQHVVENVQEKVGDVSSLISALKRVTNQLLALPRP